MKQGDIKLWLSSWPNGQLEFVEILSIEKRKRINNTDETIFRFRKLSGGTDMTVRDFLFDVPSGFSS